MCFHGCVKDKGEGAPLHLFSASLWRDHIIRCWLSGNSISLWHLTYSHVSQSFSPYSRSTQVPLDSAVTRHILPPSSHQSSHQISCPCQKQLDAYFTFNTPVLFVTIKALIERGLPSRQLSTPSPGVDPDDPKNRITCSWLKMSFKYLYNFLSNVAKRQTNKLINQQPNRWKHNLLGECKNVLFVKKEQS